MCGIAGVVGLDAPLAPEVQRAVLDAIEHRGPDAYGSWSDAGRWLGFRRLAILDLTVHAGQPMVDHSTGVALVFNGAVYNFVELRSELERRGRTFRTASDTEVVLQSYLEWGESCFERFNGMWAIAIARPDESGVTVCRDRWGEKPIHYGRDGRGRWWFSSEIGALMAAHAGGDTLNLERSLGFLAVGDVEDPTSSYVAGIEQLPPGTIATLGPSGISNQRRWFDADAFVAEQWPKAPASIDETRQAFDRAVKLRLRSDVVVGGSLSGGVDSALVMTTMRRVDPTRDIHAFTASFPGRPIDEFERASLVARENGIQLHRVEPTLDDFVESLPRLSWHQGGPFESPTVFAQWCVMRAASEAGVTVLLDGQGADETWGGYPKHAALALWSAALSGHVGEAGRGLHQWHALGPIPRPPVLQAVGLLIPGRVRPFARRRLLKRSGSWLGTAFNDCAFADPQGLHEGSLLQRAASADLGRGLLPRLLRYADRNSMAAAIEVRLPFLDLQIAALGLRGGWSDTATSGWTKSRLRDLADQSVPASVVRRREKTAYEVPTDEWLASAPVQRLVKDSRAHLIDLRLLSETAALPSGQLAWRVVALSSFIRENGLTI